MNGFVLRQQGLPLGASVRLLWHRDEIKTGYIASVDCDGPGGCQRAMLFGWGPGAREDRSERGEMLKLFLVDGDWYMPSPGSRPGEHLINRGGPKYSIEVVTPPAQFVELAPAVEVTEVTLESLRGKQPDFDLGI